MLNKWLARYANWANFILRTFVGVIFCAHGCQKLFGVTPALDAAAKVFEQYGIVPGQTWATVLGIVELIGGTALIAGLFTRYMAVLLSVIMAGAIYVVHMPYGFFLPNGVEFAFALLAANLTLLVGGPGALALDEWLERRGMVATHGHEHSIRQALKAVCHELRTLSRRRGRAFMDRRTVPYRQVSKKFCNFAENIFLLGDRS